jgi:hypothetical protein
MDERFRFFETYVRFSQMYQQIGKSLLSTLDKVCWLNRPWTHCLAIQTFDANQREELSLSNEKGVVLFRAGQNLKHLHNASCQALKGKV